MPEPDHRGYITRTHLVNLPGIEGMVASSSELPQLIFIPQKHCEQKYGAVSTTHKSNIDAVRKVCEGLHQLGLRGLVLEGFNRDLVDQYNRRTLQFFVKSEDERAYFEGLSSLIGIGHWDLRAAEPDGIGDRIRAYTDPISRTFQDCHDRTRQAVIDVLKQTCLPGERLEPKPGFSKETVQDMVDAQAKRVKEEYAVKCDKLLSDDRMGNIYDLLVVKREKVVVKSCRELLKTHRQVMVVMGSSHAKSLAQALPDKSYAIVRTQGLAPDEVFEPSVESLRKSYQIPPMNVRLRFK